MNGKLAALVIVTLLVGTGIGYLVSVPQVLRLQSEISDLKTDNDSLEAKCEQLEEVYDQLVKYFFIGDPNFATHLDENVWWGVEAWHGNPDSISEVENGILHLFYNETKGDWYGNSGLFQGRHPDGRYTHQLLAGRSSQEASFSDYVIFPKSIMSDEFWLDTKFKISRMGFNCYPSVLHPTHSRVNLGITLICAINDEPFSLEAQTLWLDVYFAGFCLNETDIWVIPENGNYVDYPDDVHAGYFVGEVHSADFGKWITMSRDLGDYICKTLKLITQADIKTVRVYGFIVFVECLGAYAEVEYDHVETHWDPVSSCMRTNSD